MELAFDDARKIVPDSAAIVDAKGYKFTFDSQDMRTGFSWISSDITLELKKDKKIYIKTPTLITNRHVATFGGMSYCKVFTPKDAAKILVDLANGEFDFDTSIGLREGIQIYVSKGNDRINKHLLKNYSESRFFNEFGIILLKRCLGINILASSDNYNTTFIGR